MNPASYTIPAIFCLLLATILQLLPVPSTLMLWKPNFLLLCVLAWILVEPTHFGVVFAAVAGLLADVIFRNFLGQYMLAFALAAYILYLFGRRMTHFSLAHQALLVFGLVIFVEFVDSTLLLVRDYSVRWLLLPASALTSALVWPLIRKFAEKLHRMQG